MYFIYRHFDKDDNLLYVGMTNDVAKRTKSHEWGAYWFNEISYITLEKVKNIDVGNKYPVQIVTGFDVLEFLDNVDDIEIKS